MDVDVSTLKDFDETTPLFGEAKEGKPSMGLDSIDSLELVVMIEKEWGLGEIASEDMTKLTTVKAIADYIITHGGAA
jgi:acyl carrier protein